MKKLFAFIALSLLVSESQASVFATNQVDGLNNIIHYGQYNEISGNDNQVMGYENRINGQKNAALGLNNHLKGVGNLVAGVGNTISGKNNFVGGHGNIVVVFDASKQEKALISQKMLSMFAFRGINGVPGLSVANSQVSDSARQSSAVFSTSKDNKNSNLQHQALETLSDLEHQPSQPLRVDNTKKSQELPAQPVVSERVQKKEEKVLPQPQPQVKDKIPTKTSDAYLVETKKNQFDYNKADNAEAMPIEDLTFFDDSKSKAKDNKPNSPVTQTSNPVAVQSVSKSQEEPRKVVISLPVEPIQPKTEVLVQPDVIVAQPEVKPVPKPVEVVKTEVRVVEAPKPVPAVQPILPAVAQQNQIQAQQNRPTVTVAQKVEAPKQDFGFKFYVNDGSTADSSSRVSSTQPSSRYSRASRNSDQVQEVVTVAPVRSSNLRQEQTPRIEVPKPVESAPSNTNPNDFRLTQTGSNAQESKQSVGSSTSSSVNANKGVSTQTFGFSSSSDNWSTLSSPSSSTHEKYKKESTSMFINAPVVISTTSTVVTPSSSSSSSSSTVRSSSQRDYYRN